MKLEEIKKIISFSKYHFGSDILWGSLSSNLKQQLMDSLRVLRFRKNQIVFQENGVPTGLYFLQKGKVKKYKSGLNGKEQIFYIATQGELLGYHALLSQEYYSDTTETLEECEIGFIPKDVFLKIFETSNEFKEQIIRVMGHEYGVLINHITFMVQYNVRERLAITLLLLKDKYKDEANETSVINISREDLANFVGTARENLIRLLNEFKKESIVETKGRSIVILKAQELVKLSRLTI